MASSGEVKDWGAFERMLGVEYARLAPLAERYYYRFKRRTVTVGGVPCMIFLGNHSSGKSTLVNWLLGGDKVQDEGLAPTDDGFTIIMYGETEEDVVGPAALSRLPGEFSGLARLGGEFLQHIAVKFRNRELLKSVSLIDSPSMIDSADSSVARTYDFDGAVRFLAESSDVVFFLLDPEKPGTTGETVRVFSKSLRGMDYKLRVLLNKCDMFTRAYDFARTYGTVCWNLSRVLSTKDLPKILTVYSGPERERSGDGIDLSDFNRVRGEFLATVRDAAARRRDNIYSQALSDFTGLSIRMCVVNAAARALLRFSFAAWSCALLFAAVSGLLVWIAMSSRSGLGQVAAVASGALAAALAFAASRPVAGLLRRLKRRSLAESVDAMFATVYCSRISVGTCDDVRQSWSLTRDETADVIRSAPLHLPLFGEFARRRLDRWIKNSFIFLPLARGGEK